MTTPMTISGPRCWWCKEAWQFNKYLRWPRPSSEPDPDPPGPKNLRNFLRRAEGRASSWFSLFIYELLWPVAVTSSQGGLEGRWAGAGAGSADFGPWPNQVKSSVRKVKTPWASVCFRVCVCGLMAAVCLAVYFSFLAIQFQVARCLFIVGLQQPPQHPAAVAITKSPATHRNTHVWTHRNC